MSISSTARRSARQQTSLNLSERRSDSESHAGPFVIALIDNKAHQVGIAAYSQASSQVELRQICDGNLFIDTLTMLSILPYVASAQLTAFSGFRDGLFVFL